MDGTRIINTTGTSVELTSSLVHVSCINFTVSITASLQQYMSEEKQEVIDNTGSKLCMLVLTLDINRLFCKHSECYCVI